MYLMERMTLSLFADAISICARARLSISVVFREKNSRASPQRWQDHTFVNRFENGSIDAFGSLMRLMLLTPSFARVSPVAGALSFARYVHRHVDDVELVFGSLDRRYAVPHDIRSELDQLGIPAICFDLEGFSGLRSWRRVEDFVQSNEVDVVFSMLLRPDLINALQTRALRIVSVRGHNRMSYAAKYGRIRGTIGLGLHRWALSRADRVFAMSPSMAEWLQDEGVDESRIAIHHNFLDLQETLDVAAESQTPEALNEDGRIHIGWFGWLDETKRPDVAIEAAHQLVHRHGLREVLLHLVGDGQMRSALEGMVKELELDSHVLFHGYRHDPLGIMAGMQLVISTSLSEGLSRVLMEALALGRTVVAMSIPGAKELIRDGETGFLSPSANVEDLAEKIASIILGNGYLSPPTLRRFIEKDFDVATCVTGILNDIRAAL